MSPTPRFEAEIARVNDLLSVVNLLSWDAQTQMPPGGVITRGQQVSHPDRHGARPGHRRRP